MPGSAVTTIDELKERIERDCAAHPDLVGIRAHNHWMIREFGRALSLPGAVILDVGASIHGFALEQALELGVGRYEGVSLDIARHWNAARVEVVAPGGSVGRLSEMNAQAMEFADDSFDGIITFGTFEHFARPALVLDEMHRVLKPGGRVLVSFGPLWTASYGHHLHHWGAISGLIPPWAHLLLDETQMTELLARADWPADAPITRDQAVHWIYHRSDINRLTIGQVRATVAQSKLKVTWEVPLRDEAPPEKLAIAAYVSRCIGVGPDDLMTRGLSLMLQK